MPKTFSDRLREVIGTEDWTPWAVNHGISPSTVEGWLNKGLQPYKKSLGKLENATGIPTDWWLQGEGPPPPPNKARQQDAPKYNAKIGGVKAQLLTPNPLWLVLAAGSLNEAEWANEMPIQERMRLVVELYNLIVLATGGDEAKMDRLFNRDTAISAALLLLHEVEMTKDSSSDA